MISINKTKPNIPKIIDGVDPMESIKNKITFLAVLFFEYSFSQIAMHSDIGKLITITTSINNSVLITACPVVSFEYMKTVDVGNVHAYKPLMIMSKMIHPIMPKTMKLSRYSQNSL